MNDPNQGPNPSFWSWYNFANISSTTVADLDQDLSASQIPQNKAVFLIGEADHNLGVRKVKSDFMLFFGSVQ